MVKIMQTVNSRWSIPVLIFLTGLFIRIYAFPSVPAGLNQDEACIGYESYALLNHGIDQNGWRLPVIFVSYGAGMTTLYAYLLMPFVRWLGLTVFSVRLENLIFGILSLIIFYFFVREVQDRKTASLAMFFLAISPWHIMLSRWGLECNILPFFILVSLYLFFLGLKRPPYLILSFIFFGLSLYAYLTSIFLNVCLISLLVIFYLAKTKRISRYLIFSLSAYLLIAFPLALFTLKNNFAWKIPDRIGFFSIPSLIGVRSAYVTDILSGNVSSWAGVLNYFWHNLKELLRILITQNDGLIWNSLPGSGTIYLFSTLFTITGVAAYLKNFKLNREFLIFAWLVITFFMGIIYPPNINRINAIFIPLVYFTARGIAYFIGLFGRKFTYTIVSVYLVCFGFFTYNYFSRYSGKMAEEFFAGFGEAVDYALKNSQDEPIYATRSRVNMPYIYFLFYGRYDPRKFVQTVVYDDKDSRFRNPISFGRFYFMPTEKFPRNGNSFCIIKVDELALFNKESIEIMRNFRDFCVLRHKAG